MFADNALLQHERDKGTLQVGVKDKTEEEQKLSAREKMMGVSLLKHGKEDYKELTRAIHDQHTFGVDIYPKTLHDTHELL